ncbi:sensor histidine kinase [Undibacterium sp. TJN19]|uniref:sensor histidine kinase n=1 Tax=Undibacterium sp. TJN19 TaxID=3413055 RepID=UPI003BF1FE61
MGAAILHIMDIATHSPTTFPAAPAQTWQGALKVFALNGLIWSVLSLIGALTSLNDDLREGTQGDFWLIFLSWGGTAIALAILSYVLVFFFSRWPWFLASKKNIALGYGLLLLIVLPGQLLYVGKLFVMDGAPVMTWGAIEAQLQVFDKFACLLRLSSISAVYFAVVTVKIWQQSHARGQAWAQERADSLALRLELEQQRGLALRAQLEPHFVFNALNAISALVIADNKDVALSGIHGLSDLLRYALAASEKTWVSFSEELAFIEDYLALQRLRYGERLHIVLEGVDDCVLTCDCPPLLLQPLIENALRHDLDCHENTSDIHCSFACEGQQLLIRISNPVHTGAAANPGVGLGLRNTQARLQLAYGNTASLQTALVDARFQVTICLPLLRPA